MKIYINGDFSYNPNFDLFINKIYSCFEQAMDKLKDKGVYLKIKILLVKSNESKKNNRLFGNNIFSFSNSNNINKINNSENTFKLKEVEMKVHKLICQKLKKKNENISNNTKLILEFNEIMDDVSKKEIKKNRYRKTVLNYKFNTEKKINPDYLNCIFALAKKNYLNKLINKENIKTNKINTKLLQFFGNKKQDEIKKDENSIDNNINNNEKNETIKENYENGLEVEINSEENEELVKLFESQFLKSV